MPEAVIPAASATAEDDKTAPTSSEVQTTPPAAAPTPAATPKPDKPSVAADVTRQLMAGKIDGVEPAKSADPATVADVDEQPATPPRTAKPSIEPPAAEAPVLDLPKVRHPFDDAEDPTLDDIDGRAAEKTRAGFERLKGRLRQAREEGQFGSMLIDTARSHGLEPNELAEVVGLTARAKKGDPQALAQLHTTLGKLGIAPPPAALPALDKEALLDVESSKVYKELFAADVTAGDMSEDKAREKAKVIADQRLATRALSQSHTPSNTPNNQAQPQNGRLSPMHQAASNAVEQLAAKYADAYKKGGADFAPVQKAAQELIAAKVAKEGPINPIYWEYEFAQAVAAVQRKRQTAAQKPQTPTTSLRPSNGSGASGGKSGDDFRRRIVDNIVSGNIDKL